MSTQLRRLWISALTAQGGESELPDASAQHARVLRLAAKDSVELFDGKGQVARGILTALGKRGIHVVYEAPAFVARTGPQVTLIQALPKGEKLDSIVRMATELGVARIALAHSERSVPKPKESPQRFARLERIALEACAQSRQAYAPELLADAALAEAAERAPTNAHKLVFWEDSRTPLAAALASAHSRSQEAWVVIGPEGGLSRAEVESLRARGYADVSMGAHVLRVETAAPVAVGILLDRMRESV